MGTPHKHRDVIIALGEFLEYDPSVGGSCLIWKKDRGRIKAGSIAGTQNEKGYWVICFDKKMHKAHRVVWLLNTGTWPSKCIDHIDGNPSNNQIENLRDVSLSENQMNRVRLNENNTSGFQGVCWHKAANKWKAAFGDKHLGLFDTPEEGFVAYEKAKKEAEKKIVKREGWVALFNNVRDFPSCCGIYETEELCREINGSTVKVVRIEWEEES